MKRNLFIAFTMLFIPLSAKGQNLFFIGEQSYTSTPTFTLQSNYEYGEDLKVLFGKNKDTKILGVSAQTGGTLITDKFIIYLDDGTVITLNENVSEYVDKIAKAAFYLSDQDLDKIINSNINTIRYTLDSDRFLLLATSGNFTASNTKGSIVDFSALVADFFEENKTINSSSKEDYIIQHDKNQETVNSASNEPGSLGELHQSTEKEKSAPYELQWEGDLERAPVVQPLPENTSDVEATLTIRFEVKPDGTVGRIIPLRKMKPKLEREVTRTLRSWRFSRLPSGVPQQSQWGTITFRFVLE